MKVMIGKATDTGKIRNVNEDCLWTIEKNGSIYAIVADGMGGHNAGEVASGDLINILRFEIENRNLGDTPQEICQTLLETVKNANSLLYQKGHSDPKLAGMGTTITLAFSKDNVLGIIHVGDSRGYLIRNDAILRVTNDHSLVEELYQDGKITKEEAKNHPQRNMITRAVGCDPHVLVDVYKIDLNPGDLVFLCTDGLTNLISDQEIMEILRKNTSNYQKTCDQLVLLANDRGGNDNITAVLFDANAQVNKGEKQ